MKKLFFLFLITSLFIQAASADLPRYQDDQFKRKDKSVLTIWESVPFFPLGDIGQYEKTMSQDRDSVRKMFWNELMSALEKMAEKGAAVELMLKPMAQILMMFDQVHDSHKAKDVINIDRSLEVQFKALIDQQFLKYDIRQKDRRFQFSAGTDPQLIQAYIREISVTHPLGKEIYQDELNVKYAMEMYDQIDFITYGTFSSLGRGQFMITLHMQSHKTGVQRAFTANGRLLDALEDVAKQVFDYFQKNVYPDWETPSKELQWLPQPVNPNKEDGYTYEEAKNYCMMRGYRLPYARELLMASSGSQYRVNGIESLVLLSPYPVLDKRMIADHYVLVPGSEDSAGPIKGSTTWSNKGRFWCVKGSPDSLTLFIEKLWEVRRKYPQQKNIIRAVDTLRYEYGDFGADEIFWKSEGRILKLERMDSIEGAMNVLRKTGIQLELPISN